MEHATEVIPMSAAIILSLALLQAAGAAAPAQPASPPAQASAAAPAAQTDAAADQTPPDPTVCRTVDVSGSAFPRKECHRLSAWNRIARENN